MEKVNISAFRLLGLMIGFFLLAGSALAQTTQESNEKEALADNLIKSQISRDSNPPITLQLDKVPIKKALKRIAGQAQAGLYYNSALLPNKTVSLNLQAVPLSKTLQKVLAGTSLRVVTSGRNITLRQKRETGLMQLPFAPVQETISGTVTDGQSGETLPGVNILVKGTTTGTSTDSGGNFELTVPSLQDTLVVSFIGYQTNEVHINGRTEINIAMQSQTITGEEMVVVGYGTQRRSDVTGAVSSVSSEDIETNSISTPDEAMRGKVAGVNVSTSSHAPGGGISVQVRGTASLSAGGQPLYVIDGMPISNNFSTGAGDVGGDGTSPNPLNSIDPSEIQSINILKDASATAIYGSRGANGVVIVTTKEGSRGQQNIDYVSSISFQQVSNKLDFMSGPQWARQMNEAAEQLGLNVPYNSQDIASMETTDWQDALFRTAPNVKQKLAFSGGSEDLQYRVSGSYQDQDGIVKGSSFDRYSASVNLNANISDNITVAENLMVSYFNNNTIDTDSKGYGTQPNIIKELMLAPPTFAARDSSGNPNRYSNYPLGLTGPKNPLENPLFMANSYDTKSNTFRLIGSVKGDWSIMDNLVLGVRFGTDIRDWRWFRYVPDGALAAGGSSGRATQVSERTANILNENTLTYTQNFNDLHRINLLAGFTYQQEKLDRLSGEAYDFPSNFYKYNNLGLASSPQSPGSYASKWNMLSYLGRLNYSFNNKYFLTASGRIDGSSKFGINNKYGVFPSVALSWQMEEEKFIEDLNIFSQLKLRTSFGVTGNEGIGVYNSLSLINTARDFGSGYVFNNQLVPVAYPSNLPNNNLSWEKTSSYGIGLDMGFFTDRVNLSADYYYKKTTDLLLNVPIPTQTGYGSILQNTGSMENEGFELAMTSYNLVGDFNWNTQLNFSTNRNEILSLGGAGFLYDGWVGDGNVLPHGRQTVRLEPGHPLGAFYGSVYAGIWESQEQIDEVGTMPAAQPGDMRFADTNGDGIFDSRDDEFIGDPNPDFQFGITNDFAYKQWDLHVFMYGKYGNDVLNLTRQRLLSGRGVSAERLDRWTPSNPNANNVAASADIPRLSSSYLIEDGSFLRLQNVTLSYNIPVDKFAEGIFRSAKISIAVNNAFVLTNYSGYDPEVNSYGSSNTVGGMDRYGYPAARSYSINVNLGF